MKLNVLYGVARAVRWSLSLGGKLFRVVPGFTLGSIAATVLAQLFLLVGFLLPLKVVLLLGSDHVPAYFPAFLREWGRDWLIVILSAASVLFYLMHLLFGKLVETSSLAASGRLLLKSKKIALFDNQDEIASKGYQRYTQSLAGVCFVSICLVGMFFFYSKLAVVIFLYMTIGFLLVVVCLSVFSSLAKKFTRSLGTLPKVIGSVGFLVAFGFIVFDHLVGDAPGLLTSVVCLLLARQLFGRATGVVGDIHGLYSQKAQLSALFFHGQVFHPQVKNEQRGIWSLLEPNARKAWLRALLRETAGHPVQNIRMEWCDIGVPDVYCFLVSGQTECFEKTFLIKLFNVNRNAWAKHEATLLTSEPRLPSLPLVSVTVVEGVSCHIFDATGYSPCGKAETSRVLADFRTGLSEFMPSTELVAAYIRSRPLVWQRLNSSMILRVQYLLDAKVDGNLVERLINALSSIEMELRELPLAVSLPNVRPGMLWKSSSGQYVVSHWSRWDLEPLGSRWPYTDDREDYVDTHLRRVKTNRSDCESVTVSQVQLSALFAELEFRIQRAQYAEAYLLMSPILLRLQG
ncbi:hypothetical protein [Stutzerimonas degradans]|uniref:hypothetical protein n=1 Tax=Stutzerimonas degradans TaxID=2968968 RepID=UPI0013F4F47B|nr:hypothetical protein [Stutzerimonas degradans]NHC11225.1 hypothetical protein [Stutzerimonas degradans]